MYTWLSGQGLAENSEALRPNPSQLCTSAHFGLSLNLVNCNLKMKSLQPLLPAKLTIILKLTSRQEPEELERLKRSSRQRASCSQIHSTPHLPGGVQCARTKCTTVCVSSYPLAMFPLSVFFCTLLLPSEGMTLFPVSCPRLTSPPTLG